MWDGRSSGSVAARLSGIVLVGIFLAISGLIFLGIFLIDDSRFHFVGLFSIGVLALIFSFGAYLAQALSRAPGAQRALAWGFGAFGFGLLFLTVLFFPFFYGREGVISVLVEIVLLVFLLLLLAGAVVGVTWAARSRGGDAHRDAARREWQAHPAPSAFSYAAAQPPMEAAASPVASAPPKEGS